jgi:hypothetical protein
VGTEPSLNALENNYSLACLDFPAGLFGFVQQFMMRFNQEYSQRDKTSGLLLIEKNNNLLYISLHKK